MNRGVPDKTRVLNAAGVRAYYDRFGKKQDSQGFYEDPALDDLISHANFQDARQVFEFGCGTGKFAARILEKHLPTAANYLGCDISPVMIGLATHRLAPYGARAQVVLSDGALRFPLPDCSVDRVISNYVLDLLDETKLAHFFAEAGRVMMLGGKVCVASLTRGVSFPSRLVSSLWMSIFQLNPALVGGCRPIHVEAGFDPKDWVLVHRRVVTPFWVPSEVLILAAKDRSNSVPEPSPGL